jgi:hypothetical protein
VPGPLSDFDVIRDDVRIGPLRLTVARPRSAEDLIDEDDYARDERLPYWAELWPSGLVLAERLTRRDLAGRRVVELGCGVASSRRGGASVGARHCWYAPALAFTAPTPTRRRLGRCVDWDDPPAARLEAPTSSSGRRPTRRNGPALATCSPPGGARRSILIADPAAPRRRP